MSFGKIGFLLSKLFTAAQTLEPGGVGIFDRIGWLFTWIWEGICLGIYNIIRWLLALVDFMQYFVQKLIGLDYWLNRTVYTMEGALESDIIFGFLYNETVQKVFRAMMGVFFVLLIIFTIFAIIRTEWEHINGTGKSGKFGDGSGNSKTKIFRSSMKAIAIVLIFPILLMVGIMSSNAILASLIKALNIDTSSTLGGQLFQIASQNANRYEKYAHDPDGRTAVSDEVSFYIKDGKYISFGNTGSETVIGVDTYEQYLGEIASATKYTVRTVFDQVGGVFSGDIDNTNFNGYLIKLIKGGEPYFMLVNCQTTGDVNTKEGMYYYLKCVLQVPIVNKYDSYGFKNHDVIKKKMATDPETGFISNMDLNEDGFDEIEQAMKNTWNYASIYKETYAFEDSLDYVVTRKSTNDSPLAEGNLGVNSAKVMYNTPLVSTYFDGGERGIVQMQSEYLVMAEVVDFINQNNFRLHILDVNSPLINWDGFGSYKVDSKWVGNKYSVICGQGNTVETKPFVISYSDSCNETEMGNVLYFGDNVGGNQSELKGAKYIMCIKVEGDKDNSGNLKNAIYIPLVNNKTYTDPVTGKMYNFKSSYYSSSYKGLVLAKGILDSGSTNAYRGEPTYLVSGTKTEGTLFNEDGNFVGKDIPYYYEMKRSGGLNQFAGNINDTAINNSGLSAESVLIDGVKCTLTGQNYYYDLRRVNMAEEGQTPVYNKQVFNIYSINTGDEVAEEDKEKLVSPSYDMIRALQIDLYNNLDEYYMTAEYAGQSNDDYFLFKYNNKEGFAFYFMVYLDVSSGTLSILTYNQLTYSWDVANYNSVTQTENILKTITQKYEVYYDLEQTVEEKDDSGNIVTVAYSAEGANLTGGAGYTADYFEFVKTVTKKVNGNNVTKAIYQTIDMESFTLTKNVSGKNYNLNKTLYFNVAFNTTLTSLVSIKDGQVVFAEAYYVGGSRAERYSDPFIQSSQFINFYLYDFYHAYVSGSVKKVDPANLDSVSDAMKPSEEDDDWFFECKIDDDGFLFPAQESYLHLYDGGRYVATIYKVVSNNSSDSITDIDHLDERTTYILYNDNYYYNIMTQNKYDNQTDMKNYYQNVSKSMVIKCVRDNRSLVFLDFDFYFVSLIPSLKIRFNAGFGMEELDREWVGHEFYITEGIQFDYFFEGKSSLITFYIPSKISYWIIIIASALMIKVLGTAIWGVIKRIYEITLYFIAAPAVASTIPLDDGSKFASQIQQPLIRKVLGTYGTMLGINVFFILLYPVKSLSQIFTPEDIATSNSYFLKNFFSLFGREFQAKMLNMYVYILFVLVAFTMISALPGIISQMLGADDVHAEGDKTKKAAQSNVQDAMDTASGKKLMDAGKKAVDFAKNSAPGKLMGLGAKGVKGLKSHFSKGVQDDDEDGEEKEGKDEEKSSSRTDEQTAQEDTELQNKFNDRFKDLAGDKFGGRSYEEIMANGTDEEKAEAQRLMNQAESEVSQQIQQTGTDEQKEALARHMTNKEESESNKNSNTPENVAKNKFTSSTEEIAQNLVGDKGVANQMQNNAIVNLAGKSGVANQVIAKAMGANPGDDGKTNLTNNLFAEKGQEATDKQKERKKEAVLSTMNDEEKAKFEKMNDKQQENALKNYNVNAEMDEDGKVKIIVVHVGENGEPDGDKVEASGDAVNNIMQNAAEEVLEDENGSGEMQEAIDSTDGAEDAVNDSIADNVATAIDFSTAGTEGQDAVAEMVINSVLDDPTDSQNGAVIDNAMLDFIQDPENKKIKKEFQKLTGLSDADMQNEDLVLKNIETLRAGGTGIAQLGITADSYKDKMGGALQEAVQKGDFKVSAWDFYNKTNEDAAQKYVENVAAENMIRSEDDANLEKEKSLDGIEAIIQKMIEQLLAGKNYADIAEAEYDKEHGKGEFSNLKQEDKDKLIAQTETKEKEQAEAQARGQMMFAAFAQNAEGNSDDVNNLLRAAMGITDESKADIIDNSGIGKDNVTTLKNLGGYDEAQIAQAIKAVELMGETADYATVSAYLNEEKANPDAHNQKLLEAIQTSDKVSEENRAKVYQMLGGGNILDEDQKQKLIEQTASNGMMALNAEDQEKVKEAIAKEDYEKENGVGSWDNLDKENKDKLLAQAGEKANGMSLYEVQAIAAGKTQQEAFEKLHAEAKERRVIDNILAQDSNIPIEKLIETAQKDPEAVKYIETLYAQRMSVVGENDRAEAQKEAENEVIAENAAEAIAKAKYEADPKNKGKKWEDLSDNDKANEINAVSLDLKNNGADGKTVYAAIVGGDAKTAESKLNDEVNNQLTANIKDKINSDPALKAERDSWLKDNPTQSQDDFVEMKLKEAESGNKKTLKALGFVDENGDADKAKLEKHKAEIERQVIVGAAKETYGDFNGDVALKTTEILEKENRDKIVSGEGAKILKTAEILDKGNASGSYGKFINEANAEYQRLYGKDKNLSKEDPIARATFLSNYMQKRGFTLEADDVKKVEDAKNQAEATGKAAADKVKKDAADKAEEDLKAQKEAEGKKATEEEIAQARENAKNSDETKNAAQSAAIFAQLAANPAQFQEMFTVMKSYDGGEEGNKVAKNIERKYLKKKIDRYNDELKITPDDYKLKNPDEMGAKERKRYEFNKGILQQEMRTNNDVVGNLFKNTNLLDQEEAVLEIAKSSGMKFDEKIGSWIDADGKALKDKSGNNIGKDNMVALKAHLDNTAIANYMNSHEVVKDKLLNLGAQDMMLTMDKETQEIKKADAVLSSSYLRNQVSNKVLIEAGLKDKKGELDETQVKNLIKQMLKANGRDSEANDKNIEKNFAQYKTELALHDLSRATEGVVGGRNADAFVKATAALENDNDTKFKKALDREVTRVIDPASYDPETSSKEFFKTYSISDFKADDGSEIHNLADALDAFHKEGFGGFKKGAKNIIGNTKGGMTEGGIVGGFKTMFVGGYGEGNKHGGVVGNDGERGGIVGGLETIAGKGVLGSAKNLLTLKAVRAGASAIKESKQVKLDNGQDISYVKYKTGGYELDENGKVKRDENGKAILAKKKKLSGAEEIYAKEQFAKEEYAKEKFKTNGITAAQAGYAKVQYAKEQYARVQLAKEEFVKQGGNLEYFNENDTQLVNEWVKKAGGFKVDQHLEQYSEGFDENVHTEQFAVGFDVNNIDEKYLNQAEFDQLDETQKKKYEFSVVKEISENSKYTAGFDTLSEADKHKYTSGFENLSSTKKAELAAGLNENTTKKTVSREEVVQERAKQMFAQDEYAREKYIRERGDDIGFDELTEDQKSTYTAGFDKLDEATQSKYSEKFVIIADKKKQAYIAAAEKTVTKKDVKAANKAANDNATKERIVEQRAKQMFAQDEYAREQYAKEQYKADHNGSLDGFDTLTDKEKSKYSEVFDKLEEDQKSTYTAGFDKLDEDSQNKYSAGFDASSENNAYIIKAENTVTKKDIETAEKAEIQARQETYSKKAAIEKRAKETFAQDEYAKEQYAKEHGSTEGFDLLSASEKSQYSAGFAKLSKKEQAKYAAEYDPTKVDTAKAKLEYAKEEYSKEQYAKEQYKAVKGSLEGFDDLSEADKAKYTDKFDTLTDKEKSKYSTGFDAKEHLKEYSKGFDDLEEDVQAKYTKDATYAKIAEVNVTDKEIQAAGKAEINESYVSGFKRFRKVSNAVLDNTATGNLLKQTFIGVGKIGTGVGLGVGKIGTGIGLGIGRGAVAAVSPIRKAGSFVSRNHRLFKSNNTEMLEMVQEARKDKLIMKEVGEDASTADIAKYLDKNKVAGENIRNRVYAKKAREIADTDATFAEEMVKAGVDLTDEAAVAEHLSKNKKHRNRVKQEFKKSNNNNDFVDFARNDRRINEEAKQHAYSDDEIAAKINAEEVDVDVTDQEIAAQAYKSSFIKAKLGPNATMQDVQAYLDSHKSDKDKFTVAAQVQAIKEGRAGKHNGVEVGNVLDKMLIDDKKATEADGTVVVTDDVVNNYFKAIPGESRIYKRAGRAIGNTFASATGNTLRGLGTATSAVGDAAGNFFLGKKIGADFSGVELAKVNSANVDEAYARYKYGEDQYARNQYIKDGGNAEGFDSLNKKQKEKYKKAYKDLDVTQRQHFEEGFDELSTEQGKNGEKSEREKYIDSVFSKTDKKNDTQYKNFKEGFGDQAYYEAMTHQDRLKIENMTVESFTAGKKGLINDETKETILRNMVGGKDKFEALSDDAKKALEDKYSKLTVAEARQLSGDNENFNTSVAQFARMAAEGKREGFGESYLGKGVAAVIKTFAGQKDAEGNMSFAQWYKSAGITLGSRAAVEGLARTFVGKKDSVGNRHFKDSGIAKAGIGIGKTAIVGWNAVVFKTAKKLPETCAKYENWNKILDHKIREVKRDTTLTREQKEKQIRIYESQKIYLKKPDEYANMTDEEQGAFDLAQDKLKKQAFTDPKLASFVRKMERAERAGNPAATGLSGELTHAGAPSKSRKEKHLTALNEARAAADRFRATAAMRNKERDYGDEFEKFARTFMSRKRYFDMIKRYKLKTAIQYQMLSAEQKEKERRKREEAMRAQLNSINRTLAKKVAKDNKVSISTYMASRGLSSEMTRYRDGSFRYRDVQNAYHAGLRSRDSQVAQAEKDRQAILELQKETTYINNMMNEFITFSSTFKGSSEDFAKAFKKEFEKYGPYAQKIYNRYAISLKGLGKQAIGLGALERSPIAVQQRKIMEGMAKELSKCKQRITMNGKIPASSEINNLFIAKTFTGATTKAELALHQKEAEELSRLNRLIKDQRNHVSYESLTQRLAGVYMTDFMKKNPKIGNLSEEAKKNKLENYFKSKLDKALKAVHNDTAFVAEKNNLEKLNGRRVKKSEINQSKHSKIMSDAMKTQDNPVYQSLVREVNSTTEKYKLEKTNLDQLVETQRELQMMPKTPKTINEIVAIEKAIKKSKVQLNKLETNMKNAQNKKRDYERAFASTQIKEAKANSRVLANNNASSVFVNYAFPKNDGSQVVEGTKDAKEVQMLVNQFISQYKQTIQNMINSSIVQENSEIKRYVEGMKRKFTADFGRNMKYTRDIKDELTRHIELIEAQGDKDKTDLLSELKGYVQKFNNSNKQIEEKMNRLGIDVKSIRLKK